MSDLGMIIKTAKYVWLYTWSITENVFPFTILLVQIPSIKERRTYVNKTCYIGTTLS